MVTGDLFPHPLLVAPGTKVFVMPNGMLKSNQQLVDIIEKVKPEIRLLIEKCNTVSSGGGWVGVCSLTYS